MLISRCRRLVRSSNRCLLLEEFEVRSTLRWRRQSGANSSLKILTLKKFFGGFWDIRAVFRARLGAHRVALSGSEIKGFRIFARAYARETTEKRGVPTS